jgi:hypothetical protein
VKTAVSIPQPVFEAADRLAKSLGIPRSQLYSRAIERYLSETQQQDVTAKLNQVYGGEKVDVDPMIAALQAASLVGDSW